MAAPIRHFLHSSTVTGSQALGTAFNTSDVHAHDLFAEFPPMFSQRNYQGIVDGIFIRLTSGSSPSATKVVIRVCCDAAGDHVIVPDTEAELVAGVTDGNKQCAAFSVGLPLFQPLAAPGNSTLYVFAKVDNAGTAPTMTETTITWRE
jgi:hypothetical protein